MQLSSKSALPNKTKSTRILRPTLRSRTLANKNGRKKRLKKLQLLQLRLQLKLQQMLKQQQTRLKMKMTVYLLKKRSQDRLQVQMKNWKSSVPFTEKLERQTITTSANTSERFFHKFLQQRLCHEKILN